MQADGAEPGSGEEMRSLPEHRPTEPAPHSDANFGPGGRTAPGAVRPPGSAGSLPVERPTREQEATHTNSLGGNASTGGASIQARDVKNIIVHHPPSPPAAPPPPPAPPSPPDDTALVMRVDLGGETIEFFDESVARIFINVRWGRQ